MNVKINISVRFACVTFLTEARYAIEAIINLFLCGIFHHIGVTLYAVQGGLGSRPGIRLK